MIKFVLSEWKHFERVVTTVDWFVTYLSVSRQLFSLPLLFQHQHPAVGWRFDFVVFTKNLEAEPTSAAVRHCLSGWGSCFPVSLWMTAASAPLPDGTDRRNAVNMYRYTYRQKQRFQFIWGYALLLFTEPWTMYVYLPPCPRPGWCWKRVKHPASPQWCCNRNR